MSNMKGGMKDAIEEFRDRTQTTVRKALRRSGEYLGLTPLQRTPVSNILSKIVFEQGTGVFLDMRKLQDAMCAEGANGQDIYRLCLICQTSGFRELLEGKSEIVQADIDRFLYNAVRETGLTRTIVIRLSGDLIAAAGIAEPIREDRWPAEKIVGIRKSAYVIPWSLYKNELRIFERRFRLWSLDGASIGVEELNRLRPLVEADIPEAKYYLASYMLQTPALPDSGVDIAISYLQDAAQAGHMEAAAALGDYYYKKGSSCWAQAYACYTGYGAAALNQKRRNAVTRILNHRRRNDRILFLCICLFVMIFAAVIFAPGIPLYGRHPFWGIVCLILCAALLAVSFRRHRLSPCDNLYHLPVGLFSLWSGYMLIRLLF